METGFVIKSAKANAFRNFKSVGPPKHTGIWPQFKSVDAAAGMAGAGLFPKVGLSFPELVRAIVEASLDQWSAPR